jgi:amidohydrolase
LRWPLSPWRGLSPPPPGPDGRVKALLDKNYPHVLEIYKNIHAHPELGFHEFETAAKLAKEMRAIGFTVTEKFGGASGLVAIYRNGPGPVIMVRTELDALPMEEKTGLPYASRQQRPAADYTAPGQPVDPQLLGKMTYVDHSCGHDIHMAWWIATAQALVALKSEWQGTLMFVGEPAEEIGGGATAMLKAGLYTKFPKPDYAFAAHVRPGTAGAIGVKAGAVSANSDTFHVIFKGRGGHGSNPQMTIDPIVMAARFVMDVQTVVSREKAPSAPGVISVGNISAGSAGNIIPDQADVRLTMRSNDAETRANLLDGMQRTARAVAMMAKAPDPEFQRIGFGATAVMNSPDLIERQRPMLNAVFGDRVTYVSADAFGGTGADTYAELIEGGIPSIFYSVSGTDPKLAEDSKASGKPLPANHSAEFAPTPEVSIKTGAELLTMSVLTVAPLR